MLRDQPPLVTAHSTQGFLLPDHLESTDGQTEVEAVSGPPGLWKDYHFPKQFLVRLAL